METVLRRRRKEPRRTRRQEQAANRDLSIKRGRCREPAPTLGDEPFTEDERAQIELALHEQVGGNAPDIEDDEEATATLPVFTKAELRRIQSAVRHTDDSGPPTARHRRRRPDNIAPPTAKRRRTQTTQPDDASGVGLGDDDWLEDEDGEEGEMKYDVLAAIVAEADLSEGEHQQQVGDLGPSQRSAYDRAVTRHENLFITGGAGKGKSHVLRAIIEGLRQSGRTVAVLAPTGVAAHHVHGLTVHSFLHLPPAWYKRSIKGVLAALRKKPEKLVRFQVVEAIVIDEISMVPAKLFDWLNRILQMANDTTVAFGGKQIIVCGDFHQLPPVSEPSKPTEPQTDDVKVDKKKSGGRPKDGEEDWCPFCFETAVWAQVFPKDRCVELVENFRQKDPRFIELLNRARVGDLSDDDLRLLRRVFTDTRSRLDAARRGVGLRRLTASEAAEQFRVRLYGLCAKVAEHNAKAEKALQSQQRRKYHLTENLKPWTEKQQLHIDDLRQWFKKHRRQLPKEKRLYHAEHLAQFDVTYEEARERLTDDLPVPAEVELSVGSRVMLLKNWKLDEGLVHGRAGWVTGFGDEGPIVLFDAEGPNSAPIETEVPPQPWTAICESGRLVMAQVPLAFAWAMTLHKAQGQSMRRADMDLGFLFAAGQGYVALSRLTSLEGLGLIDLDPKLIWAEPRVLDFYLRTFPPAVIPTPKFLSPAAIAAALPINPKPKPKPKPNLPTTPIPQTPPGSGSSVQSDWSTRSAVGSGVPLLRLSIPPTTPFPLGRAMMMPSAVMPLVSMTCGPMSPMAPLPPSFLPHGAPPSPINLGAPTRTAPPLGRLVAPGRPSTAMEMLSAALTGPLAQRPLPPPTVGSGVAMGPPAPSVPTVRGRFAGSDAVRKEMEFDPNVNLGAYILSTWADRTAEILRQKQVYRPPPRPPSLQQLQPQPAQQSQPRPRA